MPEKYKPCEHTGWPVDANFCHICGEALSPSPVQLEERVYRCANEANKTFHRDAKSSYGDLVQILKWIKEGEPMSWYDFDLDMKQLSTCSPGILYTLRGEGEGQGDVWVRYYLNGKVQTETVPTVDLPGFNPEKLE
jgi:hypothetical protein